MDLDLVLNTTADGIAVTDADGCFTFTNAAHCVLFGYTNDSELFGRSWRILYPTEEIQRIECDAMPALAEKGHWQGILRAKRKDGSLFDERLSLSQLDDGGILCLCGELTNQQLFNSKLGGDLRQQSAEMEQRGRLFSLANHELRAPMSSILLSAEMLALPINSGEPKKRDRLSAEIRQQALRVGELMDKFLFLGSQFSGVLPFSPVAIPLPSFVASLEAVNWNVGAKASSSIHLELLDSSAARMLDGALMRQVLYNLVGNACKFCAPATTIDVRLWTEGDRLHFKVHNVGPTLPDDVVQDLFEPFFRYEHSNCSAPQGSGLGLYLVRECVKAHSGEVCVRSLPDGVSVEGWILAPAVEATAPFRFSKPK